MIRIISSCKGSFDISEILKMDQAQLLEEEVDFCIEINDSVFFKQPFFPVLEFLWHYARWDKKHSFVYNSLEAQEEPVLAFRRSLTGWKIDSVWKQFDCKMRFQPDDFITAVERFISGQRE